MSKLVFKTLYIFSSSEKKAKVLSFSDKTNIITSNSIDGTKRGKSVIMKSLYHTLGADCLFDPLWCDKDKTYILTFSIDRNTYYMFRCARLFKLFDENKNLIFKTIDRNELGEKLKPIFNFAVQLPKREEEKLEITPPVYDYILNFIDQDRIMGTQFASFDGLGQYPDYKENVLYYHFGAFDEKYYEIEHQLEKVRDKIKDIESHQNIASGMYEKVIENIRGVTYTQSIDLLQKDLDRTKDRYTQITSALSNIRKKLIDLRNEKAEIISSIDSLKLFDRDNEKQIVSLNKKICPFCKSALEDTLDLRLARYNSSDDIVLLSSNMQIAISEIEMKIAKQEDEYKHWLADLKQYEDKLAEKHGEINDVLAHKGFIEIKDELLEELHSLKTQMEFFSQQEKDLKAKEGEYTSIKKKINNRYYELMLYDKNKFLLEEIDEKSFQKITNTFKGGGSNKPISTVVWYMNLLKLRKEFNPTAIDFPIVFDSPNNVETDIEKKNQLYKYIVENASADNQLIVSGIGYENDHSFGVKFDTVIELNNEKYKLLCEEDYSNCLEILKELCSK